jgi:radical SAM protein with 4Fe4S-binding SPASM domain
MNEEYAQVLGKYCVSIGASFDGINKGNEGRTKTINQEKYEEKFKLMDKYGLQYGFLLVASESNIDYIHESVEYLRDVYKINGVKINYAEDVNNVGGEVSGKDFFEKAWKPFIDDYINGEKIIEDNLNEIIKRFIIQLLTYSNGFPKSNCGLKICGGGINIIEMNPDGSIYLCGRYSEDYPVAYVMEVLDNDFLALKQYKKYIGFVKEKNKHLIDLKCDTCPADFICDHGCMAFHYSKYEKYGIRKNLVCEIFKPLQRYLTENAFGILKTYYNLNKDTNGNVFINNGEDPKDIKTNSKILARISNELNLYVNIADNDKNQIIIGKK